MPQSPTAQSRDAARRILRECRLFRALSEKSRDDLAARAHQRTFDRGQAIFGLGDTGDSLIAVLSGEVRISITSPAGRDVLLAIVGAGEVFGEIAVLDGQPRTADATAQSKCSVAMLDRRELLAALNREPQAWQAIVELLCARLRGADQQLAEIALFDLPVRLANVLLRFTQDVDGGRGIPLSQRKLGEMVGASRESVNKCLAQWQRSGVLQIADGTIKIRDVEALEAIAGDPG